MCNTPQPQHDEQLDLLYLKNRDLIEALKNLRKKLGGKDPYPPEDLTVAVENGKPETKEENQ